MKYRIDLHGRVANDVTIDRSLARNPFINPAWSSLVHSTTDVDIASTLIATVMIDGAAQGSKLSWRHVSFPHRPRSVKSTRRRMTWFLCISSNAGLFFLFLFLPLVIFHLKKKLFYTIPFHCFKSFYQLLLIAFLIGPNTSTGEWQFQCRCLFRRWNDTVCSQ